MVQSASGEPATQQRVDGPTHVQTLTITGNLGIALMLQGKNSAAEAVFHDTLAMQREVLGPEQDIMRVDTNFAKALEPGQLHRSSVFAARHAGHHAARAREGHVDRHHSTLQPANTLAVLLTNTGRFVEAEARLLRTPDDRPGRAALAGRAAGGLMGCAACKLKAAVGAHARPRMLACQRIVRGPTEASAFGAFASVSGFKIARAVLSSK